MTTTALNGWVEANQRYITAALAQVRHMLESVIARAQGQTEGDCSEQLQVQLEQATSALPVPAALTKLCTALGLSQFERAILLLCAGMELDGGFASLLAQVQGSLGSSGRRSDIIDSAQLDVRTAKSPGLSYPTFSLALTVFSTYAHWDAISPDAPLRHWRLITVGAGPTLTTSQLRIEERVLHYLVGLSSLDQRLTGMVMPCPVPEHMVPSHRLLSDRLAVAWSQALEFSKPASGAEQRTAQAIPIVQLCGEESLGKQEIAAAAAAKLGLRLYSMAADLLPTVPADIEMLARLWEREAILGGCVLLIDGDELDVADTGRNLALVRLVQQMNSFVVLTGRERSRLLHHQSRPLLTFDVLRPTLQEQRVIWENALGATRLNGHLDVLLSQFNLSTAAIYTASAGVLETAKLQTGMQETSDRPDLVMQLWDACRLQARPKLDDLAQRIEPAAGWPDLVLPLAQQQVLRDVAAHVRQRARVYETWGFGSKGRRGLGISALFAGASGTGKTLAAEVLARELRLDLYRIDLSSLVSKYIGETEKNLRRVFDAAEAGGAILLFDEADALFGKRSDVKDSHDRYANIEVSYLLQRMEEYRGLAILTTNLKSALDVAFLRRLRFIVQFPFPDREQRAEIWRRIFPSQTPTEALDAEKLARLNVAGGNIRNIALNAAFLAADANEAIHMQHVLQAARSEYAKLEKPLTEAEIGGWV